MLLQNSCLRVPMLILNSRSNSHSGVVAGNEMLFQKGSRTKYCRGVNSYVILLTYSVLGWVMARYGKAICLTFSWLIKVFTAL